MWGLLNLKSQNQQSVYCIFSPDCYLLQYTLKKKIRKSCICDKMHFLYILNKYFVLSTLKTILIFRITFESEITWSLFKSFQSELPYKLPFIEFLLYRSLLYWFALTWKTVSIAMENELKFEGGVPSGKLNVPPNSCIPRSAKIKMKRKSKRSSDIIDFIELRSETTRFRNDDQYLQEKKIKIKLKE